MENVGASYMSLDLNMAQTGACRVVSIKLHQVELLFGGSPKGGYFCPIQVNVTVFWKTALSYLLESNAHT